MKYLAYILLALIIGCSQLPETISGPTETFPEEAEFILGKWLYETEEFDEYWYFTDKFEFGRQLNTYQGYKLWEGFYDVEIVEVDTIELILTIHRYQGAYVLSGDIFNAEYLIIKNGDTLVMSRTDIEDKKRIILRRYEETVE